jgi:hypothetical protein
MAEGGENFDFCEYVYNPLMRQYQAMLRLMQMMRDSQTADCNDVECFSPNDPNSPMNVLNRGNSNNGNDFMSTYAPMFMVWALFAFALFMFRPSSMRKGSDKLKNAADRSVNNHSNNSGRFFNNRGDNDDDDDNSFVS